MATSTAVMQAKTGFAGSHLQIASESARRAYEIENAKAAGWFDEMMRLVPVSVVMSGAALEASANELLQDILDGSAGLPLSGSRRKLLKELKDERSGNSIRKYERLALLLEKEPDTGTQIWENAKLLVEFRNQFMHFKPIIYFDNAPDEHKLGKQLRSIKVPISSPYRNQMIQFPHSFMSYGCAKWEVVSVLNLSAEISRLMGVRDKLDLAATTGGVNEQEGPAALASALPASAQTRLDASCDDSGLR
jgi:hypothetical protein